MLSKLEDIKIWINNAETITELISLCKRREAYSLVVFNLQQAEELISKATLSLMNLSKISDNSKSPSTLNFVLQLFGIVIPPVKEYGHNWRANFLKQLEKINNSSLFDISLSQDISKRGNILIDKAKSTKDIPNPKLEEIEQLISDCNYILDIVDKNDLNDALGFFNSSGGLAIDQKKLVDNFADSGFFEDYKEINKTLSDVLRLAAILMILASLDVYLNPHYDARYYPNTKQKVQLDEKFPLVIKSEELTTILKRCINLDNEYLSNK